jgi:hypothetical protein
MIFIETGEDAQGRQSAGSYESKVGMWAHSTLNDEWRSARAGFQECDKLIATEVLARGTCESELCNPVPSFGAAPASSRERLHKQIIIRKGSGGSAAR